ncbi:HNT [Mytilus coruscus]|uniref:HNT n=1 Tax=Mytilus coruscus TaxID=42192 RepID=A0A6J8D2A6_MYTCO|nr:HNT [Mytilus coruscus]
MKQQYSLLDVYVLCTVLIVMVGYNCNGYTYPRFDTRPLNVTAVAGQMKILPCAVENQQNYTVAWMNPKKILISQGDRRLMDDIRMDIDRSTIPDWNLLIRQVRYSDHGMYTCTLNTKPVLVKRIYLTVLVPPDINEYWSSPNQVVREGSTIQLTCNATGKPQPEILWFRKTVYSKIEKKEALGNPGEILVIHNISRNCDGIYECVASNGIGNDVSKEIYVDVQFPPEVHLLNKKISQRVGKETILSCIISASPQAVGIWYKGKTPVEQRWDIRTEIYEDDPHTLTLNLRIMSLEEKDFGHYTCEASNELGGDSETMFLYEEKARTTTPFDHFTEEIVSLPAVPEHSINNGRNKYPYKKDNTDYLQDIPKDPVYQYAGGNGSSRSHLQFLCLLLSLLSVLTAGL